jgi:hypothetical protein
MPLAQPLSIARGESGMLRTFQHAARAQEDSCFACAHGRCYPGRMARAHRAMRGTPWPRDELGILKAPSGIHMPGQVDGAGHPAMPAGARWLQSQENRLLLQACPFGQEIPIGWGHVRPPLTEK